MTPITDLEAIRGGARVRLVPARHGDNRLRERAQRLWPESTGLQDRWIRAVHVVRATTKGWLLERKT